MLLWGFCGGKVRSKKWAYYLCRVIVANMCSLSSLNPHLIPLVVSSLDTLHNKQIIRTRMCSENVLLPINSINARAEAGGQGMCDAEAGGERQEGTADDQGNNGGDETTVEDERWWGYHSNHHPCMHGTKPPAPWDHTFPLSWCQRGMVKQWRHCWVVRCVHLYLNWLLLCKFSAVFYPPE